MIGANYYQGAAYVFTEPGSGWANMTQTAKLTASEGAEQDQFGWSASISGNTVVVGAWNATVDGNSQQGAAYVFTEPGSGWANMTQTAKLTASDGAAGDSFGSSVSIDGDTAVVGAPDATVGTNSEQGAAYVFGTPATPTVTSVSPASGPAAGGTTVTIIGTGFTGTTAVDFGAVAASSFTVNSATQITATSPAESAGTVDVTVVTANGTSATSSADQFTYLGPPSTFVQEAKLTASDGAAGDAFGCVLSISGNTMVVGSPYATVGGSSKQGAAYVFTESGSTWTQIAKLTASDGAADDEFGWGVSINGNTVVVGAPNATVGGNSGQGAVYVFTEPGSGWANMTQTAKLTTSDGAANNWFGLSVSISGNTVVAGADYDYAVGTNDYQVAAYVFTEPNSGWANMTQTAKLTASDGASQNPWGVGSFSGPSVSISGNTVVVGAPSATVGSNSEQGAAYVFTEPGSGWENMTQTAKLTASDGAADDLFGWGVSISGNTVVVGADNATVGGNSGQGAAYVFTEPGSGWANMTQTAKLTASDGAVYDEFGSMVSMSGNTVVVGAWYVTVGGNNGQGAAYVFTEPGSGWANMTQTAKLTASDGAAKNYFGGWVQIIGNTVVVGAEGATIGTNSEQGAVYVFGTSATPTVTSVSPASGPATGGTTVTIIGTGFTGTKAVDFGAAAASSFTVNSATQITATSPPGIGTVDVTVVTAGGTSTTSSADQYTYLGPTPCNITITGASVVNSNDQPLSSVNAGESVFIQVNFTTQGLPSSAAYRIGFTVNGFTEDTGNLTWATASRQLVIGAIIGGGSARHRARTRSPQPSIPTIRWRTRAIPTTP